jgi:hypothetical protein
LRPHPRRFGVPRVGIGPLGEVLIIIQNWDNRTEQYRPITIGVQNGGGGCPRERPGCPENIPGLQSKEGMAKNRIKIGTVV